MYVCWQFYLVSCLILFFVDIFHEGTSIAHDIDTTCSYPGCTWTIPELTKG